MSGELNTLWGFPEWRKSNRIWQLIQFITKILSKVDLKMNPVNHEAYNLYVSEKKYLIINKKYFNVVFVLQIRE